MADTVLTPSITQESETVEFKRAATLQSLAPSVVAMLNHKGGLIFVGYSDEGKLLGLLKDVGSLARQLGEQISAAVTPNEVFQITTQEEDGRAGLIIEVPPGVRKPYVYDGRIHVRSGAANHVATAAMISRMIAEREDSDERWERQPAVGVEADALDAEEIVRTLEAARRRYGWLPSDEDETSSDSLTRLNLMGTAWPTHAAVVLFRTAVVRRYTQSSVRAVVFADAALATILDERTLNGGAFQLLAQLLTFLITHLPVASHLAPDASQREEKPAYPMTVLREAVVNALIHRDYQNTASVQVRLFPDRLEIWNPGTMREEYVQSQGTYTVSHPRNPDIASAFYLRGYAEMLGVGIWRIRQEMAEADLPRPEWKNEAGGVLLTLYRASSPAVPLKGDIFLLPRQLAFLANASPGDSFTREAYHLQFAPDVSERSARNDLQVLQKNGYLKQTGRGYYTAYIRTDKVVDDPGA